MESSLVESSETEDVPRMSVDAKTASAGIEHYRGLCQKGDAENYLFDKYVFRRISIYFTIIAIKVGLRPNQATFLSLVAILASFPFLATNSPGLMLLGAALVFTYYTLDHVDGELARYYIAKGEMTPSLTGQFFDVLVHSYSANIIMFVFGIAAYRLFGYEWAVIAGFIGCIGASSFPNLVAAKVMVNKLVNEPDVFGRPEAQPLLMHLERKQRQIAAVNAHFLDPAKLRKLVGEMVGFPGILVVIILAVIVDAFMEPISVMGYVFNARLAFVVAIALLHTLKTVVIWIEWMRLFRPVR